MLSSGNGFIMQSEKYSRDNAGQSLKKYILLKRGELAYNHGASKAKQFGCCYELRTEEARIPYVYHCFKICDTEYTPYVALELNNFKMDKQLKRLVSSSVRMDGLLNISYDEYMSVCVYLPAYTEQKHIANFIEKLDERIERQERFIEVLKKYKRGLLQNMFPRKGEAVPRLRFAGFTGDWEQRKLGDIGSVSMCRRVFKEQTSEKGDVPFYKIGTFGGEPDAFISRELFEEYKLKYPYPKKGDILISASGSIGRTVEYMGNDEYFQDSNIVWLSHDERIIDSFLKCFFSTVKWSGIEGSTIKRLYNDNILSTEISLPPVPEQRQIGEFFENFDNLIDHQQQKLERLIYQKRGLLQQLFI